MINKKKKLNSRELLDYQPNRYPFLMIDYVTLVVPGKLANGYKYFTNNEWFFPIHFPGHPNVPGALQLEAMAQMLTVAITTLPGNKGIESRFYTCAVKYKREIVPGEKLEIETKVLSWKRGILKGIGKGIVSGEVACEAEMIITFPDILNKFSPKK